MTNVYDSLSRVKEQTDAYGNLWQFFIAGTRSEEVAPNGTSRVSYFNVRGNVIKDVNALSQAVTSEYDGMERNILLSNAGGNSQENSYDSLRNVLSITLKAKPGSGLPDRMSSFTYDTFWTSKAKNVNRLVR